MTVIDLDTVVNPRPEPKRDNWGRYLIKPADGGKTRAMTRATTWAKAIDDQEGLIGWKARVAMLGVGRRPDLYALCCAAKDDKELKAYVEEAADAGGAGFGRNVGSALHSFTERVDLGEEVNVPDQWRRDIAAYKKAIEAEGLRPVPHLIERVCVLPGLGVAGTLDRVYATANGELVIGDVKTGQSLDFAALSISVQLALYANADTLYDLATETHELMPEVRKDVAYVVHVPSGQGRAEVLKVPIDTGWEYAQLCGKVRAARSSGKRKGELLRRSLGPVVVDAPDAFAALPDAGQPDPLAAAVSDARNRSLSPSDRRAWILDRVETVKAAGFGPELVAAWPKGVPGTATDHPHTGAELDLICAALDIVDKRHGLPLTPDPDQVAARQAGIETRRQQHLDEQRARLASVARGEDEGDQLTADDIEELRGEINAAPLAERDLLTVWLQQATTAGCGFSVSAKATRRRRAIVRAGLALAGLCDGQASETDLAHATLTAVGVAYVADTLGSRLGRLTVEQAGCVPRFVVEDLPRMALSYTTGSPTFVDQLAS